MSPHTFFTRLATASLFLLLSPAQAAVDYSGNLARIPAADPVVERAPEIGAEMRGVHPRLLFTPAKLETLKQRIAASPLLQRVAEETGVSARRFRVQQEDPLPVVMNDTPALSMASGQWPQLAYAYALNPSPELLATISQLIERMLAQPYWADTEELDSNMGAGCNLYAVALLYDSVINDMDLDLRHRAGARLLEQARRMYYLGFKQLSLMPIKYWQQDPANNHRWYRLRGLAAAVSVLADDPRYETSFLRQELLKEADFVMTWFPHEGDCHEGSGYQQFGFRTVYEAMTILDNSFGTRHLEHPGFRDAWKQQLYYWVPGSNQNVSFGDAQNGKLRFMYDHPVFFSGPSLTRDIHAQAALQRWMEQTSDPGPGRQATLPWSLLTTYDPSLPGGDYRQIPTHHLFADMGAASIRDSWENDAVILTFKCGPYGGYALNAYRHTVLGEDGKPHYINIAHDDADANSFSLTVAGETIFHPGLYSTRKLTRDHSTLTIGDNGQIQDGDEWTQPVPDTDMRELSYLTGWKKDDAGRIIVEGEAGPAYRGRLDRFRRSVVWLPGDYILVLDDVRPNSKADAPLMWRGTVPAGAFTDPEQGRAKVIGSSGREVPFQILSDRSISASFDYWFLAGRWGHNLLRQFQFAVEPAPVRWATLIDPWNRNATMTFESQGETVLLTVRSGNNTDIWTWTAAADLKSPTALSGTRAGQPLIALTAADVPPKGH